MRDYHGRIGSQTGVVGENPEFLFQRGAKALHGVYRFNFNPNSKIRDRVVGQKSQKRAKEKKKQVLILRKNVAWKGYLTPGDS